MEVKSRLQVAELCFNNEKYPIYEGVNTVGRHPQATVNIRHLEVSKSQAIIVTLEDRHFISDLFSSNGTICNGTKLTPFQLHCLKNDECIKLGSVSGIYKCDGFQPIDMRPPTSETSQSIYELGTQVLDESFSDVHNAPTQQFVWTNTKLKTTISQNTPHSEQTVEMNSIKEVGDRLIMNDQQHAETEDSKTSDQNQEQIPTRSIANMEENDDETDCEDNEGNLPRNDLDDQDITDCEDIPNGPEICENISNESVEFLVQSPIQGLESKENSVEHNESLRGSSSVVKDDEMCFARTKRSSMIISTQDFGENDESSLPSKSDEISFKRTKKSSMIIATQDLGGDNSYVEPRTGCEFDDSIPATQYPNVTVQEMADTDADGVSEESFRLRLSQLFVDQKRHSSQMVFSNEPLSHVFDVAGNDVDKDTFKVEAENLDTSIDDSLIESTQNVNDKPSLFRANRGNSTGSYDKIHLSLNVMKTIQQESGSCHEGGEACFFQPTQINDNKRNVPLDQNVKGSQKILCSEERYEEQTENDCFFEPTQFMRGQNRKLEQQPEECLEHTERNQRNIHIISAQPEERNEEDRTQNECFLEPTQKMQVRNSNRKFEQRSEGIKVDEQCFLEPTQKASGNENVVDLCTEQAEEAQEEQTQNKCFVEHTLKMQVRGGNINEPLEQCFLEPTQRIHQNENVLDQCTNQPEETKEEQAQNECFLEPTQKMQVREGNIDKPLEQCFLEPTQRIHHNENVVDLCTDHPEKPNEEQPQNECFFEPTQKMQVQNKSKNFEERPENLNIDEIDKPLEQCFLEPTQKIHHNENFVDLCTDHLEKTNEEQPQNECFFEATQKVEVHRKFHSANVDKSIEGSLFESTQKVGVLNKQSEDNEDRIQEDCFAAPTQKLHETENIMTILSDSEEERNEKQTKTKQRVQEKRKNRKPDHQSEPLGQYLPESTQKIIQNENIQSDCFPEATLSRDGYSKRKDLNKCEHLGSIQKVRKENIPIKCLNTQKESEAVDEQAIQSGHTSQDISRVVEEKSQDEVTSKKNSQDKEISVIARAGSLTENKAAEDRTQKISHEKTAQQYEKSDDLSIGSASLRTKSSQEPAINHTQSATNHSSHSASETIVLQPSDLSNSAAAHLQLSNNSTESYDLSEALAKENNLSSELNKDESKLGTKQKRKLLRSSTLFSTFHLTLADSDESNASVLTRSHNASRNLNTTTRKTKASTKIEITVPKTRRTMALASIEDGNNETSESNVFDHVATRHTSKRHDQGEKQARKSKRRGCKDTLISNTDDINEAATSDTAKTANRRHKNSKTISKQASSAEETSAKRTKRSSQSVSSEKDFEEATFEPAIAPRETNSVNAKRGRPSKRSVPFQEVEIVAKKQRTQAGDATPGNQRHLRKIRPKVVFTMMNNPLLESLIKQLGGSVVDSVENCTVLVTESVKRSLKLLSAIGLHKPICSPKWITESKRMQEFLDPWDYILTDPEAEKKWDFSLKESLNRSRTCQLLNSYNFYIQVTQGADVLKGSIEACGGKCLSKMPTVQLDHFYVISAPENRAKYNRAVKKHPWIKVLEAEAVFDGVLRQELRFERHLLQ